MINQLLVCLVQYYAIDNKAGLKYTYTYDENRKHATKVTVTNTAGGAQKYVKNISYDGYDRVTSENYGSAIYSRTVSYPDSNDSPQERLERVKRTVNGISASNTTYEYDGLNRVTKEKVGKSSSSSSLVFENRYEYYAGKSGTNETTGLVRKEEYYLKNITAPQGSIEYEYDANGNVTEIKNLLDTGKNVSYEYDSLNRLTKETNLAIGSEWRYTYDNGGNITKKEEYNPSTGALVSSRDYGYGHSYWKDQLTSWGSYGTNSFVYDDSGNPTKYKGKTLEWEGKRLARYNESDMKYTDLSYDGNGLLAGYFYSNTYSIWGGATFTTTMTREILRDGDRILSEKVTEYNPETNMTTVKNIMYAYDEKGVSGMTVGGKKYYFVRNIFGDVTAIYNTSRVKCAEYAYDAWGTMYITLDTEGVGSLNPFRYRGYYMVSCIGLYYLTTRFYDYTTGRFLNADVPSICFDDGLKVPEGCNLYSYCLNNPVMYKQRPVSSGGINANIGLFGTTSTDYLSTISPSSGSSNIINSNLANASFRNGLFFGKGSVTGLYASGHARTQISLKNRKFVLGAFGKFSLLNVTGQIGIGDDGFSISLVGIGDIATVSGMAGLLIDPAKNTYFAGIEAKAAVFTARGGVQFEIFDTQVEIGGSVSALSAGFQFGIGIKDGEFYFKSGFALIFGYDFYIRIKFA